ncbi:MAG TPA: thioredoxin domain-containing protein [Anaerolineales bacterium]|nr:thioredoxin domain-containing protein [Anaerolineales bacterium]
MSMEKKSKRQVRREKMQQQESRRRLITIGIVTLVAAFVVFAVVWPQLRPVAEVVTAEPRERFQANDNSMGDPNAPIQIVEYSDFQCPFCDRFYTDTEPLLEQYYIDTGKILLTYRSAGNFVSGNIGGANTESQDAAAAAYCAGDQGKFWEMHDALFENNRDVENQGSFTDRRLTAIAETIAGLDLTAFQECYDSGKFEDRVREDLSEATAAGMQGTPYFVITYTVDGVTKTDTINGAEPFSSFQVKLEAILTEIGAQ